jgi:hypothetical protein
LPAKKCEILSRTDILQKEYKKLLLSTSEECDDLKSQKSQKRKFQIPI